MIFVTVGSFRFNELIKEVDDLISRNIITNKNVLCQIGSGDYIPRNCQYIRYTDNMKEYYDKSELIISHGGTGSIISGLSSKKPLIVIANTALKDNHQVEFLKAIEGNISIKWSDKVTNLEIMYNKALEYNKEKRMQKEKSAIYSDILNYVTNENQ